MHKILLYLHIIHLLKSSTCFEHYSAHLKEVYVVTVYMQPVVSSLSAGDCPVHRLRKKSPFAVVVMTTTAIWTVQILTVPKFIPLVFCVRGFSLSKVANICTAGTSVRHEVSCSQATAGYLAVTHIYKIVHITNSLATAGSRTILVALLLLRPSFKTPVLFFTER
jgi:hypothetical protein